MAKKRATLPSDFSQIIERNNIEELIAVFEKCDINAYEREYYKTPALALYGISLEFIRWLVEHGANTEATDSYGRTALYRHSEVYQLEKVKLLLELGADIHTADILGNTVLHSAEHCFEVVELLIEQGANPLAKNTMGETPLEYTLKRCAHSTIAKTAKVAELYLQQGNKATPSIKRHIIKIGENFEFHRQGFDPEFLKEAEAGLQKLYQLFKVEPVAKRLIHDGKATIILQGDTWQERFEYAWQLLIPSKGKAQTVQGELVRIAGKIGDELLRNGGCNWGKEHQAMMTALLDYFSLGNPLDGSLQNEVALIQKEIRDDNGKLIDRLRELAVLWVEQNPNPIALKEVAYRL